MEGRGTKEKILSSRDRRLFSLESRRMTRLLRSQSVLRCKRLGSGELLVEFIDGKRLYVFSDTEIDISITDSPNGNRN